MTWCFISSVTPGHFQRLRAEPDAEAVCCAGVCARDHKTIFSLQWQRAEERVPRQVH